MRKTLNLQHVPGTILAKLRDRAQREQWHSVRLLVLELMRDYGAGRISVRTSQIATAADHNTRVRDNNLELSGALKTFNVQNVPDDIMQAVRTRAQADGWDLGDLVRILIADYSEGIITPAAAPPPFDPARGHKPA